MKRITRPPLAGSTFIVGVALLSGLLWFTLAHAEWGSSRNSSGLVNAGPAAETPTPTASPTPTATPTLTPTPTSTATPTPLIVSVDVKPGSDPNSTNLGSRGVIPVAILSTSDFDAASVDAATVRFEGATALHGALEDVDGDGDLDLITHFRTQDTEIDDDATEACLTGETFDGQPVEGCDAIRIVPPWLDSDGDGFGDAVEATVGTDQSAACPTSPGHHAWPPDFDDNQVVNISDVFKVLPPTFGSSCGDADFSVRRDLAPDGVINISDVFKVLPPSFGSMCTS